MNTSRWLLTKHSWRLAVPVLQPPLLLVLAMSVPLSLTN